MTLRRAVLLIFVMLISSHLARAADFEATGRAVTEELGARAFDKVAARFDETMRKALTVDLLAGAWDHNTAPLGKLEHIVAASIEAKGRWHVVHSTCQFKKGIKIVSVTLDDELHLAGLYFRE